MLREVILTNFTTYLIIMTIIHAENYHRVLRVFFQEGPAAMRCLANSIHVCLVSCRGNHVYNTCKAWLCMI